MQGTNSFFRYKDIHRYTWAARGQWSITEYFLGNEKIAVRAYRGYDITTDHDILTAKIHMKTRWKQMKVQRTRQVRYTLWNAPTFQRNSSQQCLPTMTLDRFCSNVIQSPIAAQQWVPTMGVVLTKNGFQPWNPLLPNNGFDSCGQTDMTNP
jgi:hypothetical protein